MGGDLRIALEYAEEKTFGINRLLNSFFSATLPTSDATQQELGLLEGYTDYLIMMASPLRSALAINPI
jgi:hypothetical protein